MEEKIKVGIFFRSLPTGELIMEKEIKVDTPIKAWKNVKTGEIKTYEEWIESELPEKGNKKTLVDMMIFKDELLPVI